MSARIAFSISCAWRVVLVKVIELKCNWAVVSNPTFRSVRGALGVPIVTTAARKINAGLTALAVGCGYVSERPCSPVSKVPYHLPGYFCNTVVAVAAIFWYPMLIIDVMRERNRTVISDPTFGTSTIWVIVVTRAAFLIKASLATLTMCCGIVSVTWGVIVGVMHHEFPFFAVRFSTAVFWRSIPWLYRFIGINSGFFC